MVDKPTAAELAEWEKQIGIPMSRGDNKHRLRFGIDQNVQSLNRTWEEAATYIKEKRKPNKAHQRLTQWSKPTMCGWCCKEFYPKRNHAKWCSARCRMIVMRLRKKTGVWNVTD